MKRNGEKRAADIAQLGEYFPSFPETLGRPPPPPPGSSPSPKEARCGSTCHPGRGKWRQEDEKV